MKYEPSCLYYSLFLLMPLSSSIHAEEDYQRNILFSPSNHHLQTEAQGRVMIYDGLKSETVDTAMSGQFERIDNMMFIRTQYTAENGETELLEDGCD